MTISEKKNFIERFAVCWPVLAGVCWGAGGVFIRCLNSSGLDNPTIVFTRSCVGCVLCLLYILFTDRKQIRIDIKDMPVFLAITLSGCIGFMLVYNIAVTELSLSLTSVMLSTAPVFVLLISAVVFKERITLKKSICMIAAFIGCAMLSGILDPGTSVHFSRFGLLMGILTAVFNGSYILISKKAMTKGYGPFVVCFYSFLLCSIIMAPFVDWQDIFHILAVGPASFPFSGTLSAVIFFLSQSICTSLLPSVAYMYGMKYVDAGKVAILEGGSEPSAALLAGLILYGELPSLIGFAGMIISVVAIMVLARD